MDENVLLVLAGIAAPFVTQLVKKLFNNPEEMGAVWTLYGVSFILAALAWLASGKMGTFTGDPINDVAVAGNAIAGAAGWATLVYNLFKGTVKKI
jgi:drug/metabolite transporter (DMT)-like permease